MRRKLASILVLAAVSAIAVAPQRAIAQDVLTTAGDIYTMLGDSLNARAMMATFKPGAVAKMHGHPVHMIYVLEGGTLKVTPQGKEPMTMEFKAGDFAIAPSEMHIAENVGKTTLKALVIEITDPMAGHKH